MDVIEQDINRAALQSYYVRPTDLELDLGVTLAQAGLLLARYRETDGTIFGEDENEF